MLFNIPQFIDKEDKIVGPFTARQLGWIAGGAALLFVLWSMFDLSAFVVAAIPIVLIFGALAFYRPNNQPLIGFALSSISFLMRPKMYVWRRLPEEIKMPKKSGKKQEAAHSVKEINEKKIEVLSKILDNTR